ncbi:hypothetical protein GCM10028796_05100 [Ramlibacter monticola]|uniref:DUF2946 domain-containing protein n=1 Tax=Ramlibacter monticola TaxID=1926872 RepID=A0A936YYW1_9BURK|nr:hypothetical protein [Ramlibacter monticola]MBL0391212.1 hypothetical protein [Ramlibacter monticola]
MSRLRLLFFWLLVLAVPFQGFAATTKLLCGSPGLVAHHRAEAERIGGEHFYAHHGSGEVPPHSQVLPVASASAGMDAPGHQCGLCAACCHALGSSPAYQLAFASPTTQGNAPEVLTRIADIGLRQPDKPPRS